MNQLEAWYAKMDCVYLSSPVIASRSLLSSCSKAPAWPLDQKLAPLRNCFEAVEQFLARPTTWIECACSDSELIEIQARLSNLLQLLLLERFYASKFCLNSNRRVQASTVHFFVILRQTVLALIPTGCQSLVAARKAQRLCCSLTEIQHLVNKVLPYLAELRKYLTGKAFKDQKKMTQAFLADLKFFVENLPDYNVNKQSQIPKLIEFICVQNPIEISNQFTNLLKGIWKKRLGRNFGAQTKHLSQSAPCILNFQEKQSFSEINGNTNINLQFRFPATIRKKSITMSNNKLTVTTAPGSRHSLSKNRVNKSESPNKTALNVPQRTTTIFSGDLKRRKTSFNIFQLLEVREDRSANENPTQYEPLPFRLQKPELNIQNGMSKGWLFVRQYVQDRIVRRKLARILFQKNIDKDNKG